MECVVRLVRFWDVDFGISSQLRGDSEGLTYSLLTLKCVMACHGWALVELNKLGRIMYTSVVSRYVCVQHVRSFTFHQVVNAKLSSTGFFCCIFALMCVYLRMESGLCAWRLVCSWYNLFCQATARCFYQLSDFLIILFLVNFPVLLALQAFINYFSLHHKGSLFAFFLLILQYFFTDYHVWWFLVSLSFMHTELQYWY